MKSHSGYHWNCGLGRFFEGWYYRVTLPNNLSFAFMYAIDDPQGGTKYSGGSMQVLGVEDRHIWRTLPIYKLGCQDFYGSRDSLEICHWNSRGEGYAASDRHNQGKIYDPIGNITCTWDYQIEAVADNPVATMGWLSYLPVFAPGWQILMMHGWGSGFVTWSGGTHLAENRVYEFQNAAVYIEKNWGGAFPEKWFWMQCNTFEVEGETSDLGDRDRNFSLVSAGGERKTLGISSDVAMVEIYYQGKFYRFMPDNSEIYCEIGAWGSWEVRAYNSHQQVCISGCSDRLGTEVMVPTVDGLKFRCRDTAMGKISVSLSVKGKTVRAYSDRAALEIGGGDKNWQGSWKYKSASI
jgi:tocopherol cyclase